MMGQGAWGMGHGAWGLIGSHVPARAATHESAIATRASGCQRRARASNAFASDGSSPNVSSPLAPIHHMPGAPATGVTCGLAPRNAAVARRTSSSITTWSHGNTSRSAQRDRASVTVMPARICVCAPAIVTVRMRRPSLRAMGNVSQWGDPELRAWGMGHGAWDAVRRPRTSGVVFLLSFSFFCVLSSFAEEESILPGVRFGEAPFAGKGGADPFWFAVPFRVWGDSTGAGFATVRGIDFFPSAIACCHTAPIGNLGMRTQATRQFECTGYLHGVLRAAFFDDNR